MVEVEVAVLAVVQIVEAAATATTMEAGAAEAAESTVAPRTMQLNLNTCAAHFARVSHTSEKKIWRATTACTGL
eukprot:4861105-Pleurochrysis_carterae.AAC.1